MADRKAPCPCGSGRQYKSCCYARDRARAEPLEVARGAHERIDAANRVALPLVAAQGHTIACSSGCNACCKSFIRVGRAEAALIAAFLAEPEQAELVARFEAALPAWRESFGGELHALEELLRRQSGAPASGPAHERFVEGVRAYQARGVLCPFNDADGRCAIYPVRPIPCRATNVVETAEYCSPGRERGPTVVRHPDLQAAIAHARQLLGDSARRAGVDPGERALPEAVAAALAEWDQSRVAR